MPCPNPVPGPNSESSGRQLPDVIPSLLLLLLLFTAPITSAPLFCFPSIYFFSLEEPCLSRDLFFVAIFATALTRDAASTMILLPKTEPVIV
ncbi:hypothetical protein BDW59DRAFT_48768 [Aspergillus cavernicola]|uniref:Uncharacterized protein n=1 Tax=Aspergillus cavernicola TaxID=176166 RepID=A0ABR4J3Z1_9EURO